MTTVPVSALSGRKEEKRKRMVVCVSLWEWEKKKWGWIKGSVLVFRQMVAL